MPGYFITGTDTDVGKTVASAWTMLHLDVDYWKPVQSGMDTDIDKDTIQNLTGCGAERIHPSTYELTQALSPHEAARRDNVKISLDDFTLPKTKNPLVVEGAGGLLVPLNEKDFVSDLAAHLALPIILVCRSGLGTINHTLLSLEAIRTRGLPLAGIIISGPKTLHNRQALEQYGKAPVIAEMDRLDPLNKDSLLSVKPEIDLRALKVAA